MTGFQLVAIVVLSVLAVLTVGAGLARRIAKRTTVAWFVLWMTAAIAVLNPDSASYVAKLLGIGRGADLVTYGFILFGFAAVFILYLRLRRIEMQLTAVVRELALQLGENSRESDDVTEKATLKR